MPRRNAPLIHRHIRFTLSLPASCTQCGSLVWDRVDYWEDLLTPARMFRCAGCGREEYEDYRDGHLRRGIRPARCRCCQRVLLDAFSAVEGYGPECRKGTCRCARRRRAPVIRGGVRRKAGREMAATPMGNHSLWD